MVAGGSHWSEAAAADLRRFAEAAGLPVAVTFRRQDQHRQRFAQLCRRSRRRHEPAAGRSGCGRPTLLLVLGARLGDIATDGYTLIDPAAPGKTILHVHPDPDLPGSVYRADLAVAADAPAVVARLGRG